MRRFGWLVLWLSVWCCGMGWAAEISPVQAERAVGNWLRREAHPLGARLGNAVREVRTVGDGEGGPLFYVVLLEGGGLVVTSADDGIWPVIAFSGAEDLVPDPRNPLWLLLNQDLSQRRAWARKSQVRPLSLPPGPGAGSPEAQWAALLSDDGDLSPSGLSSVSDLRVAPLVQSRWSQTTVAQKNVYNYYTPHQYYSGCVATSGAQIMRYHHYPTASVSAGTYRCQVEGVFRDLTMMGGTYAWSEMPLVPSSAITQAQQQAIGKLLYDVGVASYMHYTSGGSGALSSNLASAFTSRFGYASARIIMDHESGVDSHLEHAVLSNLDAGFPVSLGIFGEYGHEVVGDGYGYSGGVLYVHLNMGWGGADDAWYNLPTVDAQYSFSRLASILYNLFPSHDGEVLSGRVLNESGVPLGGATVVAVNETTGATLPAVLSNDQGIYAVLVPRPASPATHHYRVEASSGFREGSTTATVGASVCTTTTYNPDTGGGTYTRGTGTVGGRWGVNLSLESTLPSGSFQEWMAERGLEGSVEEWFPQVREGRSLPAGFEYVFGDHLQPGDPLLAIRRINGRAVVETPAQDTTTLPYAEVRVVGTETLGAGDWMLPIRSAADATGKPTHRDWHEPEGEAPQRAFFRLEAGLKVKP